jgi:hypothetical protein
LFYHASDVGTSFTGCFKLIRHRLMVFILNKRVATDGHDCYVSHVLFHLYAEG